MKIERYQSIINKYLKYNAIHVRDYIYILYTHIHMIEYIETEREKFCIYIQSIYIDTETGKEKIDRDMEKTYKIQIRFLN